MRDGYLRGTLPRTPTARQVDVLAAFVAAGGSDRPPHDPERYALPAITRYGLVHVTDGGTRLYEAAVTPRDWVAFRAALNLYAWSKEKVA